MALVTLEQAGADSDDPRRSGERVVVVDDDEGVREAMGRILRAAGYMTIGFDSAEGLLQSGAAQIATGLVLDLGLPGMSGLELIDRLRTIGVVAPVVVVTASESRSDHARARALGVSAVLQKPFRGRDLIDALSLGSPPIDSHKPGPEAAR